MTFNSNLSADQQIIDWNGRNGDRWVAHQQWLDLMLAPFGEAAIAAAAPHVGENVLDIGCGSGTTTLAIAERVTSIGHVTAVDVSAPLLDLARQRAGTRSDIDFVLADAATMPLGDIGHDLLFSRFGVMFFDAPLAAFRHMREALRTGGRLTFVCWRGAQENDWIRLPMAAIRDIVPPAPPPAPDAPGPFSFGSETRVRDILELSGFTDVTITPFDHDIVFGRGTDREAAINDAVHMASEVGPLARALDGQAEAIKATALAAVREAFATKASGGEVIINGAAWIVTARNPGNVS